MFVYIVTNKVNGKQYVGQHSGNDLQKYWNRNITWALNKQGHKICLYGAIRKYGPDNFSCLPLVLVDTKLEMDLYEQVMIVAFNTKAPYGYNLTDGGEGTPGHSVSVEARNKMRDKKLGVPSKIKGRPKTDEHKRNISESKKGKKLSEEHRKNITISQTGGRRSEETKNKMRESAKLGWEKRRAEGHFVSDETKRKMSESHKKYWEQRKLSE